MSKAAQGGGFHELRTALVSELAAGIRSSSQGSGRESPLRERAPPAYKPGTYEVTPTMSKILCTSDENHELARENQCNLFYLCHHEEANLISSTSCSGRGSFGKSIQCFSASTSPPNVTAPFKQDPASRLFCMSFPKLDSGTEAWYSALALCPSPCSQPGPRCQTQALHQPTAQHDEVVTVLRTSRHGGFRRSGQGPRSVVRWSF
jgi:hypothetical protein